MVLLPDRAEKNTAWTILRLILLWRIRGGVLKKFMSTVHFQEITISKKRNKADHVGVGLSLNSPTNCFGHGLSAKLKDYRWLRNINNAIYLRREKN